MKETKLQSICYAVKFWCYSKLNKNSYYIKYKGLT